MQGQGKAGSVVLLLVATLLVQATVAFGSGRAAAQGTGTWNPLPEDPALGGRDHFAAAWTGRELLFWGGGGCERDYCGDGARYDLDTRMWTPMASAGAPSPREFPVAVWTGRELLVWGGENGPPVVPRGQGGPLGDGGAYDPATDRWRPLPAAGAPGPRYDATAVWTGTELLIWGGNGNRGAWGDGAAYDPASDRWRPLPTAGAPSPRIGSTAVWTGRELLIWGGTGDRGALGDGAAYSPNTNTWRPLPAAGAPGPRYDATAVWTGTELLIWGGATGAPPPYEHALGDGGAYDPATDRWRPLPAADAPSPRVGQTAIWTGAEMDIYGGSGEDAGTSTSGSRYDPATAAWQPLPSLRAPRCANHAALWTGKVMIVAACRPFAAQYAPGPPTVATPRVGPSPTPAALPKTGAGGTDPGARPSCACTAS